MTPAKRRTCASPERGRRSCAVARVLATAALVVAAALASCSAAPPTDIRFAIEPLPTCAGEGPQIRSVRITIIGARTGIECIEDAQCVRLTRQPRRIAEVQANLPSDLSFDFLAARGYQFEAVGFNTPDCTLASMFTNYLFCGQSEVVRFDHDQTVPIPVLCSGRDVPACAGKNVSLRPCR